MTGSGPATFASTGDIASQLDETQYAQGYGPCLDAVLANELMAIADTRLEARWPQFTPVAIEHGVLSSISVPIPVLDSVAASVNVYATAAYAFGRVDREALQDLIGHAAAAIANVHLYDASKTLVEQLRTAAQSRAVIDQALGILIAQCHCTADEAFDILRTNSQRTNRKVRDLAADIVAQYAGEPVAETS
jgi:GAF domain-containing protein